VLDITGDYRLARPFLAGVLAAAAAEVQRRYRLEWVKQPVRPRIFNGWTPPFPVEAAPPQPAPRPDRFTRLTAATRAISNIFDPDHAPQVIVEHMGHLLDATAVALVEGTPVERPYTHFWAVADANGQRALSILRAAITEPAILAWRSCQSPFITTSFHQTTLVGFPLTDIGSVILMVRLPETPWTSIDQQCGATLAAHSAAMLRHARMYTDLQAYAAQTEVLNTLALFLGGLLDPARQLDMVLQRILALTHLDAGLIMLKDEPQDTVISVPALAIEPAQVTAMVEMVIATGQPVWLCRQHATTTETLPRALAGFCDLVMLPLALHATNAGALLIGSRAHRHISGEDLTLLLTIAQQLGLTLSNARLRRVANENEALRQANHLKSAFLASVSHDLRSPLTAIRASVEDLLERQHAVSASEHRALLSNIARETARLSRFVDQLLDLSRIEAGSLPIDREWIELKTLIEDVVSNFRQHWPDCRIETLVSPTLPLLYLDPMLIGQVLWNVLENGQKYGPPDGPITIEAFCTNSHLVMSISDRGPGIPLAERRRIFDRFYRLERDRHGRQRGSGLGLAICHGIITAHNGTIWVDERPGGGSIFRIAIPLTHERTGGWLPEEAFV